MAAQEEKTLKHLQYAELHHKYHDTMHAHPHPILSDVWHKILHTIEGHHHHHAIIDQNSVKSPENDALSTRDRANRSVYGLYKLRQFNDSFFSPQERFCIDPKPIGMLRIVQHGCFVTACAGISLYCFTRRDFRPVWALRIGGLLGTNHLLWKATDWFNENQRFGYRKKLAQKYIDAYGENFLLDIAKPSYDIEELKTMKNKLWR